MYPMVFFPHVFSLHRPGLLLSLYASVYILNGACLYHQFLYITWKREL